MAVRWGRSPGLWKTHQTTHRGVTFEKKNFSPEWRHSLSQHSGGWVGEPARSNSSGAVYQNPVSKVVKCDSRPKSCFMSSKSYLILFLERRLPSRIVTPCQCLSWTAGTEDVGGHLAHAAPGFWPVHDKEEETAVVQSPFHPRNQIEQFWLQGW